MPFRYETIGNQINTSKEVWFHAGFRGVLGWVSTANVEKSWKLSLK